MEEVACSPDAKYVAYLKCVGDLRPYNLVLYDVEARRTVETDITTHEDDYSPEIAWSIDPSVLFLEHQRQVEAIRIQADRSVTRAATDAGEIILAPAFGRFAESESWDWGGYYSSDRPSDTEAYAVPGLGNHLRITRNGSTFILADNPGLMRFSNRGFSEVCILENDKELVFDDAQDLYLLDMDDRRVGKIADGSNFMLLLDRYRRRIRTE